MNFKKANNITGWIIGGIATLVYLLTMEATASFWDCGEFASVAYKLEVGHSPGAPLFMMLQRMFSLLAMGNKALVAPMINSFSAVCSGLTILFLFWTITHLAKNLMTPRDEEPTSGQRWQILGAGMVGALAYTFSDTFWFSAVEAEVYACSSFFTALTFWMILKWENVADQKYADRWLVLIMYMMGLTVGIHLLNLLAIPAIAMVYYFRRYNVTTWGTVVAFLVGCLILGVVQFGVIQGIPILASKLELLFVNDFGLPFDSGALFFVVLLMAAVTAAVIYVKRRGWYLVHTSLLCLIFIMLGFSSYMVAMIRSRADVPIDMTNPDDVLSLVSYVQREQFGDNPLFYGQDFDAQLIAIDSKGNKYSKSKTESGKDFYEVVGSKPKYVFEPDKQRLFPRIWDNNDPNHVRFYKDYLNIADGERPSGMDNWQFFFNYQMNWMWWRYFMWNYAGRQNDYQGQGDPKNANWVSGITFVDKAMGKGNANKMADGYVNNGARNQFYFLPLLLGILGIVFQFNRNRRDGTVVATLFFFTGIAIGIYLNMTPQQPRERDYAFAGSTYAYAIWIGLGVLMVAEWIQRAMKTEKGTIPGLIATAVCLVAVPALMLQQNWDDHDRSNKTLARATAYNTLGSCAPNAILLTVGDNETYPLWYAQEIEGYRTDVRVINTSLLGIDWYIDQLNYKVNDADAVPMIWKHEDYVGDRRNYLRYGDRRFLPTAVNVPAGQFIPLKEICEFIINPKMMLNDRNEGAAKNYFPTKSFSLPSLSPEALIAAGLLYPEDAGRMNNDIKISMTQDVYNKGELAQLNMIAGIAQEGWKRPLYFSNLQEIDGYGNMKDFFRQEGTVYRLMPYSLRDSLNLTPGESGFMDVAKTQKLFDSHFTYGGGERNDVYFDEKNRQMFIPYRISAARLSNELAGHGKSAEAESVLDKVVNGITEHSYTYDYTGYLLSQAYYNIGTPTAIMKASKIGNKVATNTTTDAMWIMSLGDRAINGSLYNDLRRDITTLSGVSASAYLAGDTVNGSKMQDQIVQVVRMAVDLGADQNIPVSVGQMYGSAAMEALRKGDRNGFDRMMRGIYGLSQKAQAGNNAMLNQVLNQMIQELNSMATPQVIQPVLQ